MWSYCMDGFHQVVRFPRPLPTAKSEISLNTAEKVMMIEIPNSRLLEKFNPLALRAAKKGLTILLIFSSQSVFIKHI